ncbi:MAG: alpha-amylase family glycosyl hydrolase [Bacteroidaceae bacterium]|nr:alpha-amylase family glycosyl hydrolase [Bacteroidaceae bacterium]
MIQMDKIVIYQIFTRLFTNSCDANIQGGSIGQNGCGKFNRYTPEVLQAIKKLGATHIWFTGVIAHASKTSYKGIPDCHHSTVKGQAGSPYAIRDYYDVDPDLAENLRCRKKEFQDLIDRVHGNGMKFIMDFVPNHVAREYQQMTKKSDNLGASDDTSAAFSPKNNFYYLPGQELAGQIDWQDYREFPAKATGNDRFTAYPSQCDWYETVKLNYGVDYMGGGAGHFDPIPDTWQKMVDILLFWASKNVDGFRCDMAEMVPAEFWHWAIAKVKKRYPGLIFIAEIYNPGSYSTYLDFGGFDYIYDKVGLYDTLRAISENRESTQAICGCWQRLGQNGNRMLHFMENHDEQRIASDFFAGNGQKGRAAMIVSATMDTCPVMVYAGQELGERGMDQEGFSGSDGRTTIFDYWSPDTLRRWYNNGNIGYTQLSGQERELQQFYSNLLNVCRTEKAISDGLFFDLMYVNPASASFNPHRMYTYLRKHGNELILAVANFSDQPSNCAVTIPGHAFDYLAIPVMNSVSAMDLLSGQSINTQLYPDCQIRMQVPADSGALLKFNLQDSLQ